MRLKRYQQATGRDIHIDVPLSNMAIAYKPEGMIADEIAPVVTVLKQSDMYWEFAVEDAYRVDEALRAPGAYPNRVTKKISSGTYYCHNYELSDDIPYEDLENADAGTIVTERGARANYIKMKLMLGKEQRVANLCTSGSNVGSYSAVASAWTDGTAGNSDPIGDVNTGINNVQDLIGVRPNKIVFGQYAWRNFREHANVISRIYGETSPGNARTVTREQTAALFEVKKVMVGGAYYNSAAEGQSASLAQLWFDNVLIYFAPDAPSKEVPSFMYDFRWKKIMDMQARVFQISRAGREDVQLGYYGDEKITGANLGFLVTGVGSSQ